MDWFMCSSPLTKENRGNVVYWQTEHLALPELLQASLIISNIFTGYQAYRNVQYYIEGR